MCHLLLSVILNWWTGNMGLFNYMTVAMCNMLPRIIYCNSLHYILIHLFHCCINMVKISTWSKQHLRRFLYLKSPCITFWKTGATRCYIHIIITYHVPKPKCSLRLKSDGCNGWGQCTPSWTQKIRVLNHCSLLEILRLRHGSWVGSVIESIKTTSMEDVSTRVLKKNKEYLRR